MIFWEFVFWAAAAAVVYAYAGYPVVVWVLSRVFGRKPQPPIIAGDDQLPSLTLLIAAHNEEDVIADRLRNALAMSYPSDRLKILVASDGSSDHTAALVSTFADQGVRLLDLEHRRGKSSALNAAMAEIDSEVVLLSDANTQIEPNAARSLARWFADPSVGIVCGRLMLKDPVTGTNADGLYWAYETFLKKCEGRLGALLGSNGAIYAIRRELYTDIPARTIVDDFVIPLQAKLRSKCRIVYDYEAVATEETAHTVLSEFCRRSRIGAGGFQALTMLWRLLSPRWGWLAFAFVSHKLMRWLCPFALIAMLLASGAMAREPFYRYAFLAQLCFYLLSGLAVMIPAGVGSLRAFRLATMFTSMNAALAVGFWRWVSGMHSGVWQPTARVAVEGAGPAGSLLVARAQDQRDSNSSDNTMPDRSSNNSSDQTLVADQSGIRRFGARDLAMAGALAAVAVGIMFDAWKDIARLGLMREEMSYVLLAPLVIAWVALSRRQRLIDCPVRREWAGLAILLMGWVVFVYGYWTDPVLWRAAAVVITIGAIISALGLDVLIRLLPAFVAAIFLIPISPNGRYQLAEPLQTATAQVTQTVCDILGIYVTRSGNLLSINGANVTVAEACNGMRMVLTLLMVCYVVAFTSPMSGYLRALLLFASPVVAIAANVVRLVPTVWMFGHTSEETAESFHSAAGWVMTVIAFLFLMGVVRALQWAGTPEKPDDVHPDAGSKRPVTEPAAGVGTSHASQLA